MLRHLFYLAGVLFYRISAPHVLPIHEPQDTVLGARELPSVKRPGSPQPES
jgi:hypothetical protein